jgi:chromosome segregation ATPase
MMTPQIYVKLTQQIARQTPEAKELEAQAAAMQPGIDSAQAWLDSCQASVDAAQTALTEAGAVEGADTTAQQDALSAAQATLESAKADLAKAKAPPDTATAHAKQIRAQIEQCQAQIDQSGMTMTQAEMDAIINAPVVPQTVTMRQARLALLGAGKLALVDAAIDSMPEPQKSAARIEWEYSNEVQRHNSFVSALGPALGMTSAQIDQLFIAAAKL